MGNVLDSKGIPNFKNTLFSITEKLPLSELHQMVVIIIKFGKTKYRVTNIRRPEFGILSLNCFTGKKNTCTVSALEKLSALMLSSL